MALQVKTLDETGLPRRDIPISYDTPFIERDIFKTLARNLTESKEIEVIIGPRQCGKTTLLAKLVEYLQKEKNVSPNRIIYCNLDWIIDYSFYENPLLFWERIKTTLGDQETIYLFLDEVQRLKAPGKFLKGLFDLRVPLKMIISGSSSLEIRTKTKEFLTGRKREVHIHPVSMKEWALHQGTLGGSVLPNNNFDTKDFFSSLKTSDKIIGRALRETFLEMAQFGGYPKVLLSSAAKKKEVLEEIYTSYVKKDVVDFFKIERPDLFNNLVKTFSHQIGNLINYSELSSLLGGNQLTVKKYVEMLEQTGIVCRLSPLVGNKRNEIRQAQKVFFFDNGLRNFAAGALSTPLAPLAGSLLENFIFGEFHKIIPSGNALYFWRTKAGSEVDFVVDEGNKIFTPVEVKGGIAKPGVLTKSFHSFLETYKPRRAFFANQSTMELKTFGKTTVVYLPFYWLPVLSSLFSRAG